MAGDSSEKSKVPKAYCDTNTLFNKIKEPEELDALEQLLQMRSDGNVELYRSAVVAREVMDTKDQEKRKKLLQDYDALTR